MQLQTTILANKIMFHLQFLILLHLQCLAFGGAASTSMIKMNATSFKHYYYRQNKLKEILTVGAMQEVGEVRVKRLIVRGLFPRITQMWQALLLFAHTSGACVPDTQTREVVEAHTAQTWVGTVHMQTAEWKETALCKKQAA